MAWQGMITNIPKILKMPEACRLPPPDTSQGPLLGRLGLEILRGAQCCCSRLSHSLAKAIERPLCAERAAGRWETSWAELTGFVNMPAPVVEHPKRLALG